SVGKARLCDRAHARIRVRSFSGDTASSIETLARRWRNRCAALRGSRGNPAVLGNESVRPEALRPRLSASLPLERFDNRLRRGDKSSGLVAFSRHLIWLEVAICREFEVMSYGSEALVNPCQ